MTIVGKQLEKGAALPDVTWNLVGGVRINLAEDLKDQWRVVVLLRGRW